MLELLLLFGVVAIVLPGLTGRLGTRAFLVGAIAPAAAFAHALIAGPSILGGHPLTEHLTYLPTLGLELDLRMDALSWVMTLVVTGVGALVLLYCVRYFRADEPGLGRFAGVLTAFAGAMYGLVNADNTYLLFVMWEATSVLSYLLIGHYTDRRASRGAALQALLVTTAGGLTMLVGLVILQSASGTSTISELVAHPPRVDAAVITGVALVLVGAASKSAIWPFHFWLPGAMAAPTPVSAYLHAAAMVKAGVYLILRLAPGFAVVPGWHEGLVSLGVLTMLVGGVRALREHDLKLVLAGGTVGQLGFLVVVASIGTRASGVAALTLLVAHALFKSTLFLSVGIIDHAAETRDLRRLSGLGRAMPVLAGIATLAALSMAGIPPLLGFVAKESVFEALLDQDAGVWGVVGCVGIVLGSVLTAGYAARFLWGAFARKSGVPDTPVHREAYRFLSAPALLGAAGLVLGVVPALAEPGPAGYGATLAGDPTHLALWHGLGLPLGLSAISLAGGAALFAAAAPVARFQAAVHPGRDAEDAYRATLSGIDRGAARVTATVQRGSLPFYLTVILLVFTGSVTTMLIIAGGPRLPALFGTPAQIVVAVVMSVAAIAATLAGKRFQAVVLTGVTGFGMAVLFALQGAPDLALTQALVDLVTLVAFVLVLRRLPARLGVAHGSSHPVGRAALGVAFGVLMSAVVVTAIAARTAAPISLAFPTLAVEGGHGTNVVNVTIVDIRGWDTMGELSVLIAAATGVASLVFVLGRGDRMPGARRGARRLFRRGARAGVPRTGSWLLVGPPDGRDRSVLLDVVVRLTFHALIVVSVYLLFAGHNAAGGGFAGGLVAGLALVARYLAAGRFELAAAAPMNAGTLLGGGLLLAVGTAAAPMLFGEAALTSAYESLHLGWFGDLSLVSSTVFDIGVYLVVVGVVLDVLRSLGAEVDRQYEEGQIS